MLELLLASENLAFSIALVLMLMIAVLEGMAAMLGVGLSSSLESLLPEADFNPHAEMGQAEASSALSRFLGWLRIGQVPLLMLLVVFLLNFGLTGLILQAICISTIGFYLYGWLASISALLLTLPLVRFWGGVLQRIMPRDETTAVTADSLLGRIALITLGTARHNYPAEARVKDQFGYSHYIRLEPDNQDEEFIQGTQVLLLSRHAGIYKGMKNPNPHLTDQEL